MISLAFSDHIVRTRIFLSVSTLFSKAFSKESRALISDLLVKVTYPRTKLNGISSHISHFSPKDPKQRLGAEDGALGVKQHFYFAKTNWELLEQVKKNCPQFVKVNYRGIFHLQKIIKQV